MRETSLYFILVHLFSISENEVKNRWYAVLSKRSKSEVDRSFTHASLDAEETSIGLKRKIEKAYDASSATWALTDETKRVEYNEEECESFIRGQ